MVTYKCTRCNKNFVLKGDYSRHITRKNPCIQLVSENIQIISEEKVNTPTINNELLSDELKCKYCGKIMKFKNNLYRHMKDNCKIKKDKDNEKETILQEILQELKELKEKNKSLEDTISKMKLSNKTIINNSKNSHNTNNIETQNNFISINAYGKEDISHISEKTWQSIMNKCFDSVPQLVGYIHYDDDKPENHNVYISNIKSNYVITYNGNNWILQEKDKILDDIYTTKIELLEDKLIELDNKLDDSAKRSLKKFLDKQEDNDIENMIKEKIKLRLYNNKKKPIKVRKIMES